MEALISLFIRAIFVENMVFGLPEVTTAASNDFSKGTRIARQMVTRYGMSSLGPVAYVDNEGNPRLYGEAIAERIDTQTLGILRYCENKATEIIYQHRWTCAKSMNEHFDPRPFAMNFLSLATLKFVDSSYIIII